jgi:hypothetical protein
MDNLERDLQRGLNSLWNSAGDAWHAVAAIVAPEPASVSSFHS